MSDIELKNNSKTITDKNKVILMSYESFKNDICEGNCCFICGAKPETKSFNDEHILPDWLLRRFDLHSRFITLPNLSKYKYGQYKIPCCVECNSLMGELFENPISNLTSLGFEDVANYIQKNGSFKIYIWMLLIFLKTHLKDSTLKMNRDLRQESGMISDSYDWSDLYSIYCIARSFYSETTISANSQGTFFLIPAKNIPDFENFDYCDLTNGQGMLLRINEICFICIFNDACGSLSLFLSHNTDKKYGSFTPIQYRELFAHLTALNLILQDRPSFYLSSDCQKYSINVKIPEKAIPGGDFTKTFGNIFSFLVTELLSKMNNSNIKEIREMILSGKYTYIFDKNGNFNNESIIPT